MYWISDKIRNQKQHTLVTYIIRNKDINTDTNLEIVNYRIKYSCSYRM